MKVPDYDQIVARLRTLKGIAVTCETNVAAGDRGDGDSLEPILNGLVYALSVARGTKVQCVYCDVFNAAGERVERRHLARITKLCGGLTPLDPSSPREAANQRFIERGYELFLKRRVTFCLDVGTIDAYLDAKAEGDYLEIRGAKLAVALEALKHVVAERKGEASEFALAPKAFEKIRKALREALKAVLQRREVPEATVGRLADADKVLFLDRPTFKELIEQLAAEIDLHLDKTELQTFVKSRNSLIHRGCFSSQSATDDHRRRVQPPLSRVEEFFFDVYFLDRIFLRLLGHEGEFLDARRPDGSRVARVESCAAAPRDG